MQPQPPEQPDQPPSSDPDRQDTSRLDDLWVPGQPVTDTVTDDDPPRRAGWRGPRVLVAAAAVLALLAAGAFGFALARTGGSDELSGIAVGSDGGTDDDAGATDEDGDDDDGRLRLRGFGRDHHGGPMMRGGFGFGAPLMGPALHGEYVVADPDGGYRTVLSQRGTVTAASDTSLSVRSDDGFTATYRLTDDTVVLAGTDGTDGLEKGAEVAVAAERSGGTTTAVHVVDLTGIKDRVRGHLGPPQPAPSESGSTSGTAT